MSANDDYTEQDAAQDAGEPTTVGYESRTGQKTHIPVQADADPVEDPIDPEKADSDEQLEADDANAIDEENIIDDRTRGAAKPKGTYRDPGDDEGLPGPEDGTSSN